MLVVEAILKLSRNKLTVHQAQKIAKDSYWKKPGLRQKLIWATFKGKSIQSYSVAVLFTEIPAYKCNCSSRQKPCKHVMGLMLYQHDNPDKFKAKSTTPEDVLKWLKEKKNTLTPEEIAVQREQKKILSEKNKTSNREKRIAIMQSGAFRLQEWLQDIVKRGIAELEGQPVSFWEEIGSRVVDHKLGGLSRYFTEMQNMITEDEYWIEKLPLKIAWINQVLAGLQRFEQWKPAWQQELLNIGGVAIRSSTLEQLPGLEDDWAILHLESGETDNGGFFRKSWMIGKKSNRVGYQLDYNFKDPKFQPLPKIGRWFPGEVVFYPGPTALRFILRNWGTALLDIKELPGVEGFSGLNDYYLANLRINPWLLDLPVIIQHVIPIFSKTPVLIDRNRQQLSLHTKDENFWKIMAISAGEPIAVFGIWNGYELDLKGISKKGHYFPLD